MSKFPTLYDVLSQTVYVLDCNGECVYGNKPKEDSSIISENKIVLMGREYSVNYVFTKENAEYADKFPIIFEAVVSLLKKDAVKTYRQFSYLYAFLCSVLKREVSDSIICERADMTDVLGTACVGERGLLAAFALLTHYLSKRESVPSFSYKNNMESLDIFLVCNDAKEEIPQFLQDYCKELAKNSGFSLDFGYENQKITITAHIQAVLPVAVSFTEPQYEDYTFISLLCMLLVA